MSQSVMASVLPSIHSPLERVRKALLDPGNIAKRMRICGPETFRT